MTKSTDRPIIQLQAYQDTPRYVKHGADDDKLAILVCRIKVWKPSNRNWFDIPTGDNCLVIREVESIEISNSYKELISKAVLKFPRGTIVEKRYKANEKINMDSGNGDGKQTAQNVKEATANGDLLTYSAQQVTTNKTTDTIKVAGSLVSLDGKQVDVGLTNINKHLNEKDLLDPNDFNVDNRIEIYLGYAYSEDEFKAMQADDSKVPQNMEMVFTGFVTACSVSTPLEVECENMAHVLTTINVPNITEKGTMTIDDFLSDNGRFHLLKDTGIKLSNSNGSSRVEVGKFQISSNLTVADVLSQWSRYGLTAYMENNSDGTSSLRVGRVYYAGKGGNSLPTTDKNYITYNPGSQYNIIQFDWDVAQDNLSLTHNDKKYLAIKATGRNASGEFFSLTLRKNDASSDDWISSKDDGDTWSVVNKKVISKRAIKRGEGYVTTRHTKDKIKLLDNYDVQTYISQTYPCTEVTLLEEAKQYWNKYVPNGISGTISIFGDRAVNPSDIIGLIDPRQPQKNGYYLVESVNITFGTSGYRKELKIPYKIANFKDYPVYQV